MNDDGIAVTLMVVAGLVVGGYCLRLLLQGFFQGLHEGAAPLDGAIPPGAQWCANDGCGCANSRQAHFCRRCGRSLLAPGRTADAWTAS